MQKPSAFKGKIFFSSKASKEWKKTLMSYQTTTSEVDFDQNMMVAFDYLNLSAEEKKQLSVGHRKILNYYRNVNPFNLNHDALELINQIKNCKNKTIFIKAYDYGAYICLAALYSGQLPTDKQIEFHLEESPIALFPKSLIKKSPKDEHKVLFHIGEDCWLKPFSTLCSNEKIKCFYLKAA